MTDPEPLWTVDDVRNFLRVSRSWVYQQAEAGRLPCLRVVGVLRFDPGEVRRWVAGTARRSNVIALPGMKGG